VARRNEVTTQSFLTAEKPVSAVVFADLSISPKETICPLGPGGFQFNQSEHSEPSRTRKRGEHRPFLGIHLKIENALQALEALITTNKKLWYEAFTITDKSNDVDLSKARNILGYNPV